MIGFRHRWQIPVNSVGQFVQDWTELTKAKGSEDATLHNMGGGRFISLVIWNSPQLWEQWKSDLHDHPLRQKYREFIERPPVAISPSLARRMRNKLK